MPPSFMRILLWASMALMFLAGAPGTGRSDYSSDAEEIESIEAVCACETSQCSQRIRRQFANGARSRPVNTSFASDRRLTGYREASLRTSPGGHKLTNGLNAPLLI
jgi:hypothetical protein